MIDLVGLLAAALALLALAGLAAVLTLRDAWPADSGALAVRVGLGLGGLLVFLAVVLTAYAYDRNVVSALLFPQAQQVQRPVPEQAPAKPLPGAP